MGLDPVKSEVADLDSLGFMENVSASLSNLFSPPSKEIQCVESIVFSSFNPPPSYRRLSFLLHNHFLYALSFLHEPMMSASFLDVVLSQSSTYFVQAFRRPDLFGRGHYGRK